MASKQDLPSSAESSNPWDIDLEELEAETNSILERFGRSRSGSRKQLYSPVPYQKQVEHARPLTQASKSNPSFRQTRSAYDGSKKRLSRQSRTATSTASLGNEVTAIDEDLRLFQADGSARKSLRNTISSALTGSKFDSVPSLLAGDLPSGWNNHLDIGPASSFREKSQNMVSVMRSTRTSMKHTPSNDAVDLSEPKSLSLQDVSFGFESTGVAEVEKEVCYNCWSSGDGTNCQIHAKSKLDSIASQNLSMCSNWNAEFLRRKYRAEDIQEVFDQQSQSLVFDKSQKQFLTKEEAKHPVYRLINQHVACLNSVYQRRQKTKIWFTSFIQRLKEGSFQNNRSAQSAKVLCLRGTKDNMAQVQKIKSEMIEQLPKAPVTGTTMREKLGHDQILVKSTVNVDGEEKSSNFIIVGPTPVPKALYRPRRYEATPTIKFVLHVDKKDRERSYSNDTYLSDLNFDMLHQDHNNFVQYVTFGRKGSNDNLAVGGLSAEILMSRRFTSCFPPQYKNITCSEERILLPPKQTNPLTVPTLEVPPDKLTYIRRELVTPLDTRRPPTIMTKVGIDQEKDRHYFGLNRVEQTGETKDCGFRTAVSYELPEPDSRIDPRTFTPSENIATPNTLAVTPFRIAEVDESYPFCQEKSRTNHVEDLYQLLLSNGECSSSKLQVFTTVGSQQVGYFMQNGDATLPIGRMNTKVVRTWAFLQSEPEKGDDPYDDPPAARIYLEENAPLNLGGVLFNDRPRYQDMPEGVLFTNSKSDARNAILRRSISDENRLDDGTIEEEEAHKFLQGHLNSIAATRVGKRQVEYLPETYQLNLPNVHCNETRKPKKSIEIWQEQCFNPWTEGKDLLSTHFVRSLSQETKAWPKVNHNKEDCAESDTAKEFAALCSLVRHGKYRDLEDTLNRPEWSLPIDYCDESGNTLLMVACQNGNRRIVKLCLRRGSKINKQNLNGNTSLHFAFGYGFGKHLI